MLHLPFYCYTDPYVHVYFQIKMVIGIKGRGLSNGSIYCRTERKELVDFTSDRENYSPCPLGLLACRKLWAISAESLMLHSQR